MMRQRDAGVVLQAAVLQRQPAMLQGVLHHHRDLVDGERLFEEIESTQFGRPHRGFDAAVAGDHHHHGPFGEGDLLDARQHFHAVHAGQPDIQQHQFEAAARQRRETRLAAFDGFHHVTFVLEYAAQGLADAGLVIHHQDPPRLHIFTTDVADVGVAGSSAVHSPRTAGISTVKRAPTGWLSSTRICALCSATMWLTIARPRPVPRFLVEK